MRPKLMGVYARFYYGLRKAYVLIAPCGANVAGTASNDAVRPYAANVGCDLTVDRGAETRYG